MNNTLNTWLIAIRPKTLPAAITPVIIGLSYAHYVGIFKPMIAFFTLIASILIQIVTNFENDVFDFISRFFGISINVMKTQNTFIITIFQKFIKL